MKYELIGTNDIRKIAKTVLNNRGIEDWTHYISLDGSVVQSFNDLDNMQKAVKCFIKHFENKDKISIIIDEDNDGYTSSAMLYLYIKSLDENYPINYVLHNKPKQHGLKDVDLNVFSDAKLVIIADASTNDANECNELISKEIDVIILDHHDENYSDEAEEEINYQTASYNNAIIVNNQLSKKYQNKELSGAGIVYRFLQAIDEELWESNADTYLDLCAVGNVGDVMDMRSFETRYFVNQGLQNINNRFLQALVSAQSYSMQGAINIHNVAWYMAPIVNAVTRIGSLEERDLLFRAFTEQYEEFDYKKRDGSVIKENIYDRAARISKNVKSRQDKQRDLVFNELKESINPNDKIVILESKKAQSGLIGVSCMKLADTFKRPTIIVKEINKDGKTLLSGSCRNFDNSPVTNFKNLILKTGAFEFCSGHGNAAGLAFLPENLGLIKSRFNELLESIDFDIPIQCDFVLDVNDLNPQTFYEVDSLANLWCTGIDEPTFAIENIVIKKEDLRLQGKNLDSVSFMIDDIKFVQFKLKEGDPLYDFAMSWDAEDDDVIVINAVGKCGINRYQGDVTPQFIIDDCVNIQNNH